MDWPPVTLVWWRTWRESAQAQTFTETDWSFLVDTAVLHAAFWGGDRSAAAELRLRVAKFGATPEDRARLRMEVIPESASSVPVRPARSKSARDPRLRLASVDETA